MLNQNLRHDYQEQSSRYDLSRGASPSVLGPLRRALDGAPGPVLYDVGGGTGNYAEALRGEGWQPTVIDASADMLHQAAAKGLRVIPGDATSLPEPADSADAVIMISMLHQVAEWSQALDEAARVLRPGGRLAVMLLTADHLEQVSWAFDLFPSTRDFALARRPRLAALTAHLPGTTAVPIWFADLADASIGALCAFPEAMLDERLRRQTSFFGRLEHDNPAELSTGLDRLREMLSQGEDPRTGRQEARARLGDATILLWHGPQ
jgi:SAM-dependent methyltransferase